MFWRAAAIAAACSAVAGYVARDASVSGAIAFFLLLLGIVRSLGFALGFAEGSPLRFVPMLSARLLVTCIGIFAGTNPRSLGGIAALASLAIVAAAFAILRDRRDVNAMLRAIRSVEELRSLTPTKLTREQRRELRHPSHARRSGTRRGRWRTLFDTRTLPAHAHVGTIDGRSMRLSVGRTRMHAYGHTRGARSLGTFLMAFTGARIISRKSDAPYEAFDRMMAILEIEITPDDHLPPVRIRPRDRGLAAFPVNVVSDNEVELESIEFDDRYELRVDREEDELELRWWIDPLRIVGLLDTLPVYVEVIADRQFRIYRHGVLDRHEFEALLAITRMLLQVAPPVGDGVSSKA